MPDPTVVKPGDPGAPPAPTPGNPPAGDPPAGTPPKPGVTGPDGQPLTFNDVLKHPEFQPFLDRQVEEKVASRTSEAVAKILEQAGLVKPGAPEDPDAEDVKQIMANFEMDEARARELVRWRNRGIDKKVQGLESRFALFDLSSRFAQVYRDSNDENPRQFEGKMIEIFNGMNEVEKNFVLYSKEGASHLYDSAKRRAGIVPVSTRVAGGGGGGGGSSPRSMPASDKTGDSTALVGQAVQALQRGDRKEYERLIAGVIRK